MKKLGVIVKWFVGIAFAYLLTIGPVFTGSVKVMFVLCILYLSIDFLLDFILGD